MKSIADLEFNNSLLKNILDSQLKISDNVFAENKNLHKIIDDLIERIEKLNKIILKLTEKE